MARILEYQQDKLASSAVGVPSQNKSGQIIGAAVADLGQTAMSIAADAHQKRNQILSTSTAAELASKYEIGLYGSFTASTDDKMFQQNPTDLPKAFQDKSKELYTSLGVDKQSPEVQRLFNLKKLDLDTTYTKKTIEWSRNQENFNAVTQLSANITRTSNAVADAARRGNINDAVVLMKNLDMTAASSTSVLGPQEAAKLITQGNRETREALFGGAVQTDPLLASKLLDHEGLNFKAWFSPEELQQKRDLVNKAVMGWQEQQKIETLKTELDDNRAIVAAVSRGETPWELLAKMPATPFKKYATDMAVMQENKTMTPSQAAYEKQRLTAEFKKIKTKGSHTLQNLKDINEFQTAIMRAGALQVITPQEAAKWSDKATKVLAGEKKERNIIGKMAGMNGLKDTEALYAGWEQIEAWSKTNAGQLAPDAEFDIFTRLIDQLDPTRDYKDEDLKTLVSNEIGSYLRQKQAGQAMSTYTNGVLRRGGGYIPYRIGPSPKPVDGAVSAPATRQGGWVTDTQTGSKIRVYRDTDGKLYDRPIGGVEIK